LLEAVISDEAKTGAANHETMGRPAA
jgi:hypothetical protein